MRIGFHQISRQQRARIDFFNAQHARILAQTRMQLCAANIDANHRGRTALQQAVGKAASGLTDIEAAQAGDRQTDLLQRRFQLEATARHVARFRIVKQAHFGFVWNFVTVLCDVFPLVALAPLQTVGNQPLRLRAAGRQLTLNE